MKSKVVVCRRCRNKITPIFIYEYDLTDIENPKLVEVKLSCPVCGRTKKLEK